VTGLLLAVETVVLALLALLVIGLLRSHAEILRRLHELGVDLDEPATRTVSRDQFNVFPEVPSPGEAGALPAGRDLSGVDLADGAVSVRVVGVAHTTLIAFLSGTCLTCERFWEAFGRPAELGLAPNVRLVVVTKSPTEESSARIAEVAPKGIPLVMSSEAWDAYSVPGSPYFVLVDGPSGRARGEGTGIDWPQVRGLLEQVADDEVFASRLESRRVAKPAADDTRERRVDAELMAAGIRPGDPSLHRSTGPTVPPATAGEATTEPGPGGL
jgi:hypothetical protein